MPKWQESADLVPVRSAGSDRFLWVFRCAHCRSEVTRRKSDVSTGKVSSCGCLRNVDKREFAAFVDDAGRARIPLAKGGHFVVDADDLARASRHKWRQMRNGYVCRTESYTVAVGVRKYRLILLHRWLVSAPDDRQVDHRDGDTLNNTRDNLRVALPVDNARNNHRTRNMKRGGRKGAYWHKSNRCWNSYISAGPPGKNGKAAQIHLGSFATEDEAARAYDIAAVRFFGEFACLNFPQAATIDLATKLGLLSPGSPTPKANEP